MPKAQKAADPIRDKRIDGIGFVAELEKSWAKPRRELVKTAMKAKGALHAEGEYFKATYSPAGVARQVSAEKFVRLFEKKKIKRKDFIAALSVAVGTAETFMNPADLHRISKLVPCEARIIVSRKEGVALKLIDAIEGIRSAIAAAPAIVAQ